MHVSRLGGLVAALLAASTDAHALPRASISSQYDPSIIQAMGNAAWPPMKDPAFTCKALNIAFGGGNFSVTDASGDIYDDLIDENYSATCWLRAACVVSPETTKDVSRVMKILSSLKTKFSIRSGGHKQDPGFGSIDGSGVLISLANLNTISVSKDKKSAIIGPGNRWNAVYENLGSQGLVAVGGRAGIVGVGGFLLGGGLSYFSNQYGLGMDNVKSYQVVLGSGRVVTASSQENPDLYKALRGGGTNYGIVTAYELYTYPFGDIYYEARAFAPDQASDFLKALAEYNNVGQLKYPLSSVSIQMQETGPFVLLQYSKPAESPAAFDAFYKIPDAQQLIPPTNGSLVSLLEATGGGFEPVGIRTYGETFSHKVDAAFMVEAYDIFAAEIAKLPEGASGSWVPNPVSTNVAKRGERNGGNVIGLTPVPQQWHEWFIAWTDASLDDQITAICDRITAKLTAAAKARGVLLPYLFMNTAGSNQKVLQSFGRKNVETIKKAAAKYDPDGVFQNLQNKGHLVKDL